jgi:hypothetical protein
MSHSLRRSPATYVAVAVSLLALLVAATTTAYAAGLAANSVGAKQLKKNAVKTVKIKDGAVTTGKVKDAAISSSKIQKGAVTADRIATGVVPARTVHVAQRLAIGGGGTPLLKLGGVSFDATCTAGSQDSVQVSLTRVGGGLLDVSGLQSFETSTSDATTPFIDPAVTSLDLSMVAPSNDGFGALVFDGVVTPAGLGPVKVQVSVQVEDGLPLPCHTYVTATPIG